MPVLPESDAEWREATAGVRDEHARIRARAEELHDIDAAHERAIARRVPRDPSRRSSKRTLRRRSGWRPVCSIAAAPNVPA
jgi:hypothetical protein